MESVAWHWCGFASYLSGRTQRIVINGVYSKEKMLDHGVPQCSVLGARLYTLYIRPLSHMLENHRVLYHTYADDTQLYVKFDRESPSSMQNAINRLEDCMLDVSHWIAHHGLILNNEKTGWLIFNGITDFSHSQLEHELLNRASQI